MSRIRSAKEEKDSTRIEMDLMRTDAKRQSIGDSEMAQ